jgi:hypothetical protein
LALLKKLPKDVVLVNIHTKDNVPALAKDAKISLHTKETNTTIVVGTDNVENMVVAHTPREAVVGALELKE